VRDPSDATKLAAAREWPGHAGVVDLMDRTFSIASERRQCFSAEPLSAEQFTAARSEKRSTRRRSSAAMF